MKPFWQLMSILALGFALMFAVTELQPCAHAANLLPSAIFRGYSGQMMNSVAAVIPISTATSAAITLNGFSPVGILFPAVFTGTTVTFMVSVDGTNFFVLKSTLSGSTLSYTVGQGTYAALDPVAFYGVNYLKIVSGSTEGAARTLTLSLKGI